MAQSRNASQLPAARNVHHNRRQLPAQSHPSHRQQHQQPQHQQQQHQQVASSRRLLQQDSSSVVPDFPTCSGQYAAVGLQGVLGMLPSCSQQDPSREQQCCGQIRAVVNDPGGAFYLCECHTQY